MAILDSTAPSVLRPAPCSLDTFPSLPYASDEQEVLMDYLSPIVGTVTGVEMAQWKDILVFGFKCILFAVPFVAIGLLIEKDVIHVPKINRFIKCSLVFVFFLPVFLFAALNYLAPGMPDAFWEKYPLLEGFWLMEGAWAPIILAGLILLYLLTYMVETIRGDLSS